MADTVSGQMGPFGSWTSKWSNLSGHGITALAAHPDQGDPMACTVTGDFFGDFKLGDNIQFNLQSLRALYAAQRNGSSPAECFRKPITLLLASVAEALIYDLFWRMKRHTREGVPNVAEEILDWERQQTRDEFAVLIQGARKHAVLGTESDGIYDRLESLRRIRNRIHIQDVKRDLERMESDVFTQERQDEAEQLVEVILHQVSTRHLRPTNASGYVGDLELPWDSHRQAGPARVGT